VSGGGLIGSSRREEVSEGGAGEVETASGRDHVGAVAF